LLSPGRSRGLLPYGPDLVSVDQFADPGKDPPYPVTEPARRQVRRQTGSVTACQPLSVMELRSYVLNGVIFTLSTLLENPWNSFTCQSGTDGMSAASNFSAS
jgi:hypothetical protein